MTGMERIRTNQDGEEVQFRPDAAASFRRLERQAGRSLDVNRTVVPYAVQADLYARRKRGEYPYPVAHPDWSNHVYRSDSDGGNAWDTDERGDWLDDNGWIADVAGEPWHREYRPWLDNHRNDPEPAPAEVPAPPKRRRKKMAGILIEIVGSPADAPVGARNGDVIYSTPEGESLVPDLRARDILARVEAHDPESGQNLQLLSAERDIVRVQRAACRADGDAETARLVAEVKRLADTLPPR